MNASLLEHLQSASAEHAEALFRKETNDDAAGRAWGSPSCPKGSLERPLLCDCPKTKAFLERDWYMCGRTEPCVVRITLFPKGTY